MDQPWWWSPDAGCQMSAVMLFLPFSYYMWWTICSLYFTSVQSEPILNVLEITVTHHWAVQVPESEVILPIPEPLCGEDEVWLQQRVNGGESSDFLPSAGHCVKTDMWAAATENSEMGHFYKSDHQYCFWKHTRAASLLSWSNFTRQCLILFSLIENP